ADEARQGSAGAAARAEAPPRRDEEAAPASRLARDVDQVRDVEGCTADDLARREVDDRKGSASDTDVRASAGHDGDVRAPAGEELEAARAVGAVGDESHPAARRSRRLAGERST